MSGDVPRTPRKGQDPPAARHLKLVRPDAPKSARRSYRRRPPVFSPAETLRLRAALRSARSLFGSFACAADAMYLTYAAVNDAAAGRVDISAEMAVRLARALGKPLDALTRPPSEAGVCPTCGARRAP